MAQLILMGACASTLDADIIHLTRFTLVDSQTHLQEQAIPQRITPCNNSAQFPVEKHHESSSDWPKQHKFTVKFTMYFRLGKLTLAHGIANGRCFAVHFPNNSVRFSREGSGCNLFSCASVYVMRDVVLVCFELAISWYREKKIG